MKCPDWFDVVARVMVDAVAPAAAVDIGIRSVSEFRRRANDAAARPTYERPPGDNDARATTRFARAPSFVSHVRWPMSHLP